MTTPTSDEQALTEQIAEKLHSDFWGSRHSVEQVKEWWSELPTLAPSAYTGYIRTARAVLPVVKAAQRDAWANGHSWGWSDAHEHHLMPQPMSHDEWKLRTPNPHDPEES